MKTIAIRVGGKSEFKAADELIRQAQSKTRGKAASCAASRAHVTKERAHPKKTSSASQSKRQK